MSAPLASRTLWICLGFLALAGFFLLAEHRAHLYAWLPFVLLLACPLLHLLLHRGHGGQAHPGGGHQHASPPEKGAAP